MGRTSCSETGPDRRGSDLVAHKLKAAASSSQTWRNRKHYVLPSLPPPPPVQLEYFITSLELLMGQEVCGGPAQWSLLGLQSNLLFLFLFFVVTLYQSCCFYPVNIFAVTYRDQILLWSAPPAPPAPPAGGDYFNLTFMVLCELCCTCARLE